MNVLLISWYFPPLNDVAALRIGALADFLQRHGHDVTVLTAARHGSDESLVVPLAAGRIVRTKWFDVNRLRVEGQTRTRNTVATTQVSPVTRPRALGRLRALATAFYENIAHIPDRQIGWLPYAVSAGREIHDRQGVDLIYASGPSFVSFMVARSLSLRFRIPWIAEYRDGWSGDIYKQRAKWRESVDQFFENRTVRSAAGIITVSGPWADYFRARFAKPTLAIYNGFDAEPETTEGHLAPMPNAALSIVHLGELYDGLRDPTALYKGIIRSGLTSRDVQVGYYGPNEGQVKPLAQKWGVGDYVSVRPRVTHSDSVRIQRQSDVLLLLQAPDDPRNVPAKLFEYFASGRPILGVGLDAGVPAALIRERGAGLYASVPDVIAEQLNVWVAEKRRTGRIAQVPSSARAGLSREAQFQTLNDFLMSVTTRV